MDIKGKLYRESGQWKIILETESWVLEDILRDSVSSIRTVVVVNEEKPTFSQNGVSYRVNDDKTHLLGTLVFEEELNKKITYE